MFSLVAFSASLTSTAMVDVAAVADDHLSVISGNIVIPPDLPNVAALYAGGTDIARAQVLSPSLRQLLNPEISPVDTAALPSAPSRFVDYRFTPIQLAPDEQLDAQAANAAAGANRVVILAFLSDGPVTPVAGDVRSVRVTAAITATANTWSSGALTFDQQLPSGRYQIVGGRFFSTTLQAFRLVVTGYPWRPGGIGAATATLKEPDQQRFGNFGIWGEFAHNTPPNLQILCTAADAAETGVLDLIKVA